MKDKAYQPTLHGEGKLLLKIDIKYERNTIYPDKKQAAKIKLYKINNNHATY